MVQTIDVTMSANFLVIDGSGQTRRVDDQINATVDLNFWLKECQERLHDYCEDKSWLKDKQLLSSVIFDVVATSSDGRHVHLMKNGYPDADAANSLAEVRDPLCAPEPCHNLPDLK